MDEYAANDVTEAARDIAKRAAPLPSVPFGRPSKRRLLKQGLAADGKVAARNLRCIQYGETEVELTCIEQLVETSQARAIGDALQRLGDGDLLGGNDKPLSAVLTDLERELRAEGRPMGE